MAAAKSTLLEGLENISEDEQLRRVLELSRTDPGRSPPGTNNYTSVSSERYMNSSGLSLEEWRNIPAEVRLRALDQRGQADGRAEPPAGGAGGDKSDIYMSDNDEDEDIKKAIERSKLEQICSPEEQTSLAIQQSKDEVSSLEDQLERAIKLSLRNDYGTTRDRHNSEDLQRPGAAGAPGVGGATGAQGAAAAMTSQATRAISPPDRISILPESPRVRTSQRSSGDQRISTVSSDEEDTIRQLSDAIKEKQQIETAIKDSRGEAVGGYNVPRQRNPSPSNPGDVDQNTWQHVPINPHVNNHLGTLTEEQQLEMALRESRGEAMGRSMSPGDQWLVPVNINPNDQSQLTEEQQLEIALRESRQDPANMSEEDQLKLALELSRSASTNSVAPGAYLGATHTRAQDVNRPGPPPTYSQHLGARPRTTAQSRPLSTSASMGHIPRSSASQPSNNNNNSSGLPPILVDGANVAMSKGNNESFAIEAIPIVYEYFTKRGHECNIILTEKVKVDLRKQGRFDDLKLLENYHKSNIVWFTPTRGTDQKAWQCYDDLFTWKYATEVKAIVVSNDKYKDLLIDPRNEEDMKQAIRTR